MRRVIAFFTWQAVWWQHQPLISDRLTGPLITGDTTNTLLGARRAVNLVSLQEGGVAYADRQARIRDSMRLVCEKKWEDIREQLVYMEEHDARILVECTDIF